MLCKINALFSIPFKTVSILFPLEKGALREKCPYSELFGPYFPAFGLNMERYGGISLRIQFEYEKIRTRIIQNMDTFYAVEWYH